MKNENKEITIEINEFTGRYTKPLICKIENNLHNVGSFIYSNIDNKLFAITSSHILNDLNRKYDKYNLITPNIGHPNEKQKKILYDTTIEDFKLPIINILMHKNSDICCIELDEQILNKQLSFNLNYCDEKCMLSSEISNDITHFICGYPEKGIQNLQVIEKYNNSYVGSNVLVVLDTYKIDQKNGNYLNNEFNGPQIMLNYKNENFIGDSFDPNKHSPRGFSGCGVWVRNENDKIWTPTNNLKLIAIQSYWLEKSKKLGTVPIKEALDLVYGN